ncbi:uncharacterized protein BXZ73DRAFT_55170 [Epithele typhae]|uniref:uncharacterized protein n=1 Tax=Epithele typhae TaxID=378194 RepID=UPI0020081606|nr:uncharacterized protein BXZ73DRAFT_55170 [Epithele typhae]KAH9914054.1 hypothetical protein BXZ73DRAFT_55170 [Epithele typhae]
MSHPKALEEYLVPGTKTTYYVPNFIDEEEEEYLIRKIVDAPQPWWKRLQNRSASVIGGELTAKKVLIPQEMPNFVNMYPDLIGRIRDTGIFEGSKHGEPNHIIMNEYAPGQGIMPHEDGPAYHPVVATLSLGAHTVFNYYQYKPDDPPAPSDTPSAPEAQRTGRAIDPKPVLRLLLEPRSLVITTSSMYADHLHGIDELYVDKFEIDGTTPEKRIANFDALKDPAARAAVEAGGILERGLRYSLTCRDVEKVTLMGGALLKKLLGQQ